MFSAKVCRFLWNLLILTSLLSKALKFCEIPKKFGENLTKKMQNLLSLLKFCEKCVKHYEKLCKGIENSEKSGVVQRQHVELEKRWKMTPWTQKSALIQERTSSGKGLKTGYSKWLRWWKPLARLSLSPSRTPRPFCPRSWTCTN